MSNETNKSDSAKSGLEGKNELTEAQLEKVAGGVGGGLWGGPDRNPGGGNGNGNSGNGLGNSGGRP